MQNNKDQNQTLISLSTPQELPAQIKLQTQKKTSCKNKGIIFNKWQEVVEPRATGSTSCRAAPCEDLEK